MAFNYLHFTFSDQYMGDSSICYHDHRLWSLYSENAFIDITQNIYHDASGARVAPCHPMWSLPLLSLSNYRSRLPYSKIS